MSFGSKVVEQGYCRSTLNSSCFTRLGAYCKHFKTIRTFHQMTASCAVRECILKASTSIVVEHYCSAVAEVHGVVVVVESIACIKSCLVITLSKLAEESIDGS